MKLYADEDGAEQARSWVGAAVVSALSLTEVLAAMWGKALRGELSEAHADLIVRFSPTCAAVMLVVEDVIARSLACVRRHRLRGADAVQLASALLAREADPAVSAIAVFDQRLRAAASAEGFALLPAA